MEIERKFVYRNKTNGKWLGFDISYDVLEDLFECDDIEYVTLYRERNNIENVFDKIQNFEEYRKEDYELVEVKITYEVKRVEI
jgi:hypothetical protein